MEIIHGYLQLHTCQKEAFVKIEDKSAVFISLDVGLKMSRLSESRDFRVFCTKSVVHSHSWEADSHTATYSRITRHYRRFLVVFTGARHRNLSWSIKTPVHTDPLCLFIIDTSIIFSSVSGLWKLSFIFRFSGQMFVRISLSSYACYILRPFLLDAPCYSLFSGFFAERNNFIVNIYVKTTAMLQTWWGGRVARM